jgi:hypothetical protein
MVTDLVLCEIQTAEKVVRSQASRGEIRGEQTGNATGFSSEYFCFTLSVSSHQSYSPLFIPALFLIRTTRERRLATFKQSNTLSDISGACKGKYFHIVFILLRVRLRKTYYTG